VDRRRRIEAQVRELVRAMRQRAPAAPRASASA
jgi:hypothetical protein